ncbi:hypothetical protein [Paenibacillus mendelii]|uniref:Uncharacterized protein n=1 Tax=Paenibacillus mendelii TaxID=206163 RepID=A0ABV6J2T3_9BACL|nr:hypothetical protein [Paenibacillus mendelii]MCQ6559294.1 hypothetical protein [Paenibacillus mendelii]
MNHNKLAWTKPELECLDVKKTEYWEYVFNPDTNFWEEVWVNES